ncbi:MAG: MGMT family protein [Clostridiales bacterium]|nr:MGMT family protein [Clostridiales bacterium]
MTDTTDTNVSKFAADVYKAVSEIPKGKVATYAQVALMSAHRGAARAVGNALHVNPFFGSVPCHRVVNASGRLAPDFAFGGARQQQRMLEDEGVVVKDGKVDLSVYQWRG